MMRTAAQQFSAGLGLLHLLVRALYALEVCAVFVQLSAKVLEALECLFLFRLYRLLLGQLAIVVDGAREGRERCVELGLQMW